MTTSSDSRSNLDFPGTESVTTMSGRTFEVPVNPKLEEVLIAGFTNEDNEAWVYAGFNPQLLEEMLNDPFSSNKKLYFLPTKVIDFFDDEDKGILAAYFIRSEVLQEENFAIGIGNSFKEVVESYVPYCIDLHLSFLLGDGNLMGSLLTKELKDLSVVKIKEKEKIRDDK